MFVYTAFFFSSSFACGVFCIWVVNLLVHYKNAIVILTIPFVIWVAKHRYQRGFIWYDGIVYASVETGV